MGMYEDYIAGKPLNERLARLMAGQDEDPEPEQPAAQTYGRADLRPLDDEDRRNLRSLKFHAGWPILLRMLDRRIQKIEDSAKQASKTNPTAKDENAAMWAEVAAFENTRKELVVMLESEVVLIGKDDEEVPKKAAKKKATKH